MPGLRRSEVADRAFISAEYYTRIEQGRIPPNDEVVRRIAAALGLSADQTRYARALIAEPEPAADRPTPTDPLYRLVDQLGAVPAVLVGPGTALLAWNPAAADLLIPFGRVPPEQRRYVQLLFTDAEFQSRFVDLERMRSIVIGIVRASAPSGLATGPWIDDLARTDPDFRSLWERNDVVRPRTRLSVRLRAPGGDEVDVDQVVLQVVDDPELRLITFVRP